MLPSLSHTKVWVGGGFLPSFKGFETAANASPVEIFQDHNQRALRRHSLECFANLPHHPSWRASQDLLLEPVSLFGFYQGWELSQPGGRMFRQHLDQRTVFRAENQRAQRFEDRVVRFLSPEAFHALAPSDPQSVIPSSLL